MKTKVKKKKEKSPNILLPVTILTQTKPIAVYQPH